MISYFKRKVDIDDVFGFSYAEKKQYLTTFPEPVDEIDRSFFQYKCQQYRRSKLTLFVLNFFSLFVLLMLVPLLVLKRAFSNNSKQKCQAIFPYKGKYGSIIPEDYKEKYDISEITYHAGLKTSELSLKELKFMLMVMKRNPINFYFNAAVLYKLSFYSYILNRYQPSVIFASSEYSFSSSILTLFCEKNMVKHINVMHGEKIFSLTDTFFSFHKCIVWDQFYAELFTSLRAAKDQFEVLVPKNLDLMLNDSAINIYDMTYYLGGEKEQHLVRISKMLGALSQAGIRVCVRYHPRYSDVDLVKEIFKNIEIENASEIDLKVSFERTNKLVSLYSTVLMQGLFNNKEVVIDDVTTDVELLNKLKEYKYYVFTKDVKWMSQLYADIV